MEMVGQVCVEINMFGFVGAFKVFCISFDPTFAFLLALVALAAVRHI